MQDVGILNLIDKLSNYTGTPYAMSYIIYKDLIYL